ncbi:hypothetical protein DJ013_01735 [Arcticibacterium luteifluviistationis]|uniref:Uncharacterized protein n=1 Tax=Arcticibacterium luteifluviistationis TaxID=1784714 RepID=A0A2Z4G796_9BACT|nr:hypothetical protein DJ013_01735 [Arcticibacterium luteifluviistationis]
MLQPSTLDFSLRLFSSLIFRFLLVINGLLIISTEKNKFDWYIYVLVTVLYLLLYRFCFAKDNHFRIARIINDYLFVFIILFDKDLYSLSHIIFTFLPIFNFPNSSSRKRLYFAPYILVFLVIFLLNYPEIRFIECFSLLFLFVIDLTEQFRSRLFRLTSTLLTEIDTAYYDEIDIKRSYTIYHRLIEYLNKSKYSYIFVVNKIFCFSIRENDFILVNSSSFVLQYNLQDSNLRKKIENNNFVPEVSLEIDGIFLERAYGVSIKSNNNNYFFVFDIDIENPLIFGILKAHLFEYLKPLLYKIAGYLNVTNEIGQIKKLTSEEYSKSSTYINETAFAMHFVRNKLNPLKNYFEVVKDLRDPKNTASQRVKWSKIEISERENAIRSLDSILTKTNKILDSTNNPFSITVITNISIKMLIALIRTSWLTQFNSDSINYFINPNDLDKTTNYNDYGLDILLTDITANAKKYSSSKSEIHFKSNDDFFLVEFRNDIVYDKDRTKIDELKLLIQNFNSERILENKQKTHGLTTIKNFANQMGIINSIEIDKKTFILCLKFNLNNC